MPGSEKRRIHPNWPRGRDEDIGGEVEGIASDGTWTTVECSKGGKGPYSRPLIDICRLELRPNGPITKLIKGTKEDTPRTVSNPVISPDGKWVAFQEGDTRHGEWGDGHGIFLMPINCEQKPSKARYGSVGDGS